MRHIRTRATDSTFDINLAPVLDIIVSIVALLLLSAAYLEVKGIDTEIPHVVQEVIQKQDPKELADITLQMSRKTGFKFVVNDKGRRNEVKVALAAGKMDLAALYTASRQLKLTHPQVFNLSMAPEKDVSLDEIVQVMDKVRRFENKETIQVKNQESGEVVNTDLMFPNVAFSNVLEE